MFVSLLHNANKLMQLLYHEEDPKSREQEKKELLKRFSFNRTKKQPDPYELWAANISACIEYKN